MTKKQRVGLSVLFSLLDFEIEQLEKTKARAAESVTLLPGCESYGGDIAVKAGTYSAAVDHAAPTLRGLYEQLRELFPGIGTL